MKPVTPTRPLKFQKFERKDHPLVDDLMSRIRTILDRHGIIQATLAKEVGTSQMAISEYLSGQRSAPYGEMALRLLKWVEQHEKK